MLKTMKNFVCKAIATAIALSAVSVPQVLFVNATDNTDTDMVWVDQYSQNFDELDSLVSDSNIVYQSNAVELMNDSTGGNYIYLTPKNVTANQSDGIGTDSKWSMFLKSFANVDNADSVKLEYKIKFTEIPEDYANVNRTDWTNYSGMHAKVYHGTSRSWAAKVSAVKYVLQNATDNAQNFDGGTVWYTITEETVKSNGTYKLITTFSQNGNVIATQSSTKQAMMKGYLMGCDAAGCGIYVDDIKISYGYNKPENFELTFTDDTAESSFTNEKVTMDNVTATVKNTTEDGNFLRLSCTDSSSTTKNTFQIKAFDNAKLAQKVTVEYKARLPKCSSCPGTEGSYDNFSNHPSLNTKFKGSLNTWAAKVCHYKAQANDTPTRATVDVEDWFTVKHVLEPQKSTDNLTTTITANGSSTFSNTKNYAPATINYYELVCNDVTIKDYIDIDDFMVTYEFDEEAKSPQATVSLYADDKVQTNLSAVSAFTDKIVINFSEPIDESTVTQNSVYLENSNSAKVSVSASFDASKKIYTMNLPSLLSAGDYKVVVTSDVKSDENVAATPNTTEFTVTAGATLPSTTYSQDYVIDFNDLTIDSTPADDENKIYYNSAASPQIVSGGVDGNALSLTPSNVTSASNDYLGGSDQKWTVALKNIDNSTNADKVVVSYDVKSSNTENVTAEDSWWGYLIAMDKIYVASNSRHWGVRLGSKRYQINDDTNISAEYDINNWTTISYTYDPKSKTVINSISKDGAEISSDPYAVNGFVGLILTNESPISDILVDNIKVSYIYNAPELTSDSITFTDAAGTTQSNWNNIDLLTKKVKIDFGAVMDTRTLTNTNVYISEKNNTDAKVGYIAEYENGVYTMNLTEALKENTDYTLFVKKEVTNVKGDKVSQSTDFSIDFKTGKGKRAADLMGVKVNGSKVTSVDGLTAGAKGQVEIAYSNTTGKSQTLNVIIAYYSGYMLKSAEIVKTENIDSSIVEMTYKYDFDIPVDMQDVTSVKVMSWSDFSEMIPLSDSIDL